MKDITLVSEIIMFVEKPGKTAKTLVNVLMSVPNHQEPKFKSE